MSQVLLQCCIHCAHVHRSRLQYQRRLLAVCSLIVTTAIFFLVRCPHRRFYRRSPSHLSQRCSLNGLYVLWHVPDGRVLLER
jgi:hypothetical protein